MAGMPFSYHLRLNHCVRLKLKSDQLHFIYPDGDSDSIQTTPLMEDYHRIFNCYKDTVADGPVRDYWFQPYLSADRVDEELSSANAHIYDSLEEFLMSYEYTEQSEKTVTLTYADFMDRDVMFIGAEEQIVCPTYNIASKVSRLVNGRITNNDTEFLVEKIVEDKYAKVRAIVERISKYGPAEEVLKWKLAGPEPTTSKSPAVKVKSDLIDLVGEQGTAEDAWCIQEIVNYSMRSPVGNMTPEEQERAFNDLSDVWQHLASIGKPASSSDKEKIKREWNGIYAKKTQTQAWQKITKENKTLQEYVPITQFVDELAKILPYYFGKFDYPRDWRRVAVGLLKARIGAIEVDPVAKTMRLKLQGKTRR